MENTNPKTFEELGLSFQPNAECVTCRDLSCHNNVTYKADGQEYIVHIWMDEDKTEFTVAANLGANTNSESDLYELFHKEEDAVKFLCDSFDGFKCA